MTTDLAPLPAHGTKPVDATKPTGGAAARLGYGPLVLPEDGIVDPIAIEIAASGSRPVALTQTERVLAAARILAAGGSRNDIATRLHVSGNTARTLADRARRVGDTGDLWAA
jgi:DNA-binding CsgD family transcriptional regulator